MILVDTGPLVALFDPKDGQHQRCVRALKGLREPIRTTVPVLTEAFHMLGPGSVGSDRLREFVLTGGLSVWWLDPLTLARAFEVAMPQHLLFKHAFSSVVVVREAAVTAASRVSRLYPGRFILLRS